MRFALAALAGCYRLLETADGRSGGGHSLCELPAERKRPRTAVGGRGAETRYRRPRHGRRPQGASLLLMRPEHLSFFITQCSFLPGCGQASKKSTGIGDAGST